MNHKFLNFHNWSKPLNYLSIKCLDCHTAGEPLRIITGGFPQLKGETILEKRQYCKKHYDHLRKAIILEPKGHADMYASLVVEPERVDSDFGAIFLHNEGYSSMCGHAIIALTKFAVESGVVKRTGLKTNVKIDVPCGQILAVAHFDGHAISKVTFDCVPSYVHLQNGQIELENYGTVDFDIAFGGAYYVYTNVNQFGLTCDKNNYGQLIDLGRLIKKEVVKHYKICHPFEPDLGFLYGTIFIDKSSRESVHSKNICVFADGEVDRSPTGSGVSGRAAIHYLKGELKMNETITIESITNSQFEVEVVEEVAFGKFNGVIPRVTGSAYISGFNELIIDPNDPFKNGFLLR